MLTLWRGFHDAALAPLLAEQLTQQNGLMILCPPHVRSLEFLRALPPDSVEFLGDWTGVDQTIPEMLGSAYQGTPVLGLFTSGTLSGTPRLVLYTKQNIEFSIAGVRELINANEIHTIFCYPQPFHVFGLTLGYLQSLFYGLRLITPEGRYSRAAHDQWLAHVGPGVLTLGTPVHFFDLLAHCRSQKVRPTASASAIVGGAPVSRALWCSLGDELNIRAPSIGYGASEASPAIAHLRAGVEPTEDGEVGEILPGVEVMLEPGVGLRFCGPNRCLAVSDGESLEYAQTILITDELTRRPDGRHVYRGRTALVINRGGVKISQEWIENLLHEACGIPVVCLARPSARLGQDVGLLIVDQDLGREEQLRQVTQLLREQAGIGLDPSLVRWAAHLPMTPANKLDRAAAEAYFVGTMSDIGTLIPHRAPALWISRVDEALADGGRATVVLDPSANYCAGGVIRTSSYIELMAQAQACTQSAFEQMQPTPRSLKRAFLAAVTDFAVEPEGQAYLVSHGDELVVTSRATRVLGPITIIEAQIATRARIKLASVKLKVFAEV